MSIEEQAAIIENYVLEAIAIGEAGTYALDTAKGITAHILMDLGIV